MRARWLGVVFTTTVAAATAQDGWRKPEEKAPGQYKVEPGTKIPLTLINSVSTKHASEGDRVYLETAFPILVDGRIVIPPGSYVAGTITQVKKPGRVKGRGELYLRFDSLTLPNGVTRDFRARIGGLDGRASEELDRSEGKIRSEGNKGGDARTIGEAGAGGASVGAIAGSVAGRPGMGAGIGAAAGATAGLLGVLLSRGPDAVLAKGSTVEMVLDRTIAFDDQDLDFSNAAAPRRTIDSSGPLPSRRQQSVPMPGRRLPL
jgi:type IV secretion system protein VirB10